MGSGFKDFTAGDVLTAADVDGYLMRQGVMTFADDSARNTALSGVLDEGMHAYLEDENALTYYTGSAWVYVYSDWTSYTPAYAGGLTIGNASTNQGYYRYVAGDLELRGLIRFGSTTTITDTVQFTLPNSETAVAATGSIGVGFHEDNSAAAGTLRPDITYIAGSNAYFWMYDSSGIFNATNPFSDGGATNDEISWHLTVALS